MDYKKALNTARELYNEVWITPNLKTALENEFEELKKREIENERISKEIIQYINDYPLNLPNGYYSRADMITWLERQKHITFNSVEDEKIRKAIIDNLRNYISYIENESCSPHAKDFLIKHIEEQISWIEKQKSVTFDSTEDERIRETLFTCIDIGFNNGQAIVAGLNTTKEEALAWLEKQGDKDKLIQELGKYKVKYTQEVLSQQIEKMKSEAIKDYTGEENVWNNARDFRPKHMQRYLCYDKYMGGVYCYVYDDISKYWCTQTTEEHSPDGDNHICDYADYRVTVWMELPNTSFYSAKDMIEKQSGIDSVPPEGSTNTIITDSKKSKFKVGDFIRSKDGKIETVVLEIEGGRYRLEDLGWQNINESEWELWDGTTKGYEIGPEFCVDDWIACEELNTAHIINIQDDSYEVEFIDGNKGFHHIDYIDKNFHLWSIEDAKPGDVLVASDKSIFIFKEAVDLLCMHYIVLAVDGILRVNDNFKYFWETVSGVKPATKEQRDTLFAKMKEEGYEWDNEKKELKKITQKPTIQPKFKVGEWVVNSQGDVWHIDSFDKKNYQVSDGKGNYNYFPIAKQDKMRHWTIQDAKDGDVLVCPIYAGDIIPNIFIFKDIKIKDNDVFCYCSFLETFRTEGCIANADPINTDFCPATKEQRETLMKAMTDAGYTFDFEKKELKEIVDKEQIKKYLQDNSFRRMFERKEFKKIEFNPDDLIEESYQQQADDLIDTVTEKPKWSEEDEQMLNAIDITLFEEKSIPNVQYWKFMNWLKSLKDRVQPQPKQEWSEEDEHRVKDTIYFLETAKKHYASTMEIEACAYWTNSNYASIMEIDACIDWLKTLKLQNTWKPNDEQIKAIRLARSFVTDDFGDNPTLSEILIELEKQLKNLK